MGLPAGSVLLDPSSVQRMNSGACAWGSVCEHNTAVSGVLNAFETDFRDFASPLLFLFKRYQVGR